MLASYHNHTPLCNHASGTEEEYVLHAIQHGYSVFGFSDHAPHVFVDVISDSRMKPHQLSEYVSRIRALREKYRGIIDIPIGLELEYFPKTHATDMRMYKDAGIEYLILGQHLIGDGVADNYIHSFEKTDNRHSYTAYVDQVCEAMGTGDFCYFAHPDVFKYQGDADFYREESDRLILAAKKHRIPLEVNMYGMVDGRHYPNPLFWERVAKHGAAVILGRDAHSTARVHAPAEFDTAYRFIEKHGLDLIESIEIKPL